MSQIFNVNSASIQNLNAIDILVDNEKLYDVINKSPFGLLNIYTSSLNDNLIESGSFKISGSKAYLPLKPVSNEKYPYVANYSSSFARVLNNNIKNYQLSLKGFCENVSFLVKDTQIKSSGGINFYELTLGESVTITAATNLTANCPSIIERSIPLSGSDAINFIESIIGNSYYADFNLGTKAVIADEILLRGKKIESVLSNTTEYGYLQYQTSHPETITFYTGSDTIYTWEKYAGPYQFTFDSGSFWTGSKTTRIQMSFMNYPTEWDPDYYTSTPSSNPYFNKNYSGNFVDYFAKMADIIKYGQYDTTIKFTSVMYPDTKKYFKIKDAKLYVPTVSGSWIPTFDVNNLDPSEWYFDRYLLYWDFGKTISDFNEAQFLKEPGENYPTLANNTWIDKYKQITDDPVKFEHLVNAVANSKHVVNPSVFWQDYDPLNVSTLVNFMFAQYDLEVEEIYSSYDKNDPGFYESLDPVNFPSHINLDGDLFHVDFEWTPTKRKIIHFITSSKNVVIPDWAEKITSICVGAGGGGGGGASGFAHSESISFIDSNNISENDASGTEGSYVPASNKNFGHEFVTGGGGGAGGCVSKTVFTNNFVKDNRGKTISVTVGSPGKGGLGSSYFDDVIATEKKLPQNTTENDRWNILKNTDFLFKGNPQAMSGGKPIIFLKGKTPQTSTDPTFYQLNKLTTMSSMSNEYNGKPGGDTFLVIDGVKVASAQGGNGGSGGLAVRDSAQTFHLMCGLVYHTPGLVVVPGGANTLKNTSNIGDEIRVGGPGGYGVCMPTPKQTVSTKPSNNPYITELHEETIKANNAINIPWKKDTSLGEFNVNNMFPIGNTVRGNLTIKNFNLKYNSNGEDIPTKPAPTGGGGGCGILWSGIDQRNANVYVGMYGRGENGTNYESSSSIALPKKFIIPQDWLQKMANLITGSISLGLGGTNTVTEYLINETDGFGKLYSLELNSTGSHGGYGKYGINTDNKLSPNNIVYEDLQPQPGQNYGYGGGGGAGRYVLNHNDKFRTDNESLYPTKGQNGADGGKGVAIIIIE